MTECTVTKAHITRTLAANARCKRQDHKWYITVSEMVPEPGLEPGRPEGLGILSLV